jgi:hypothetical protein
MALKINGAVASVKIHSCNSPVFDEVQMKEPLIK